MSSDVSTGENKETQTFNFTWTLTGVKQLFKDRPTETASPWFGNGQWKVDFQIKKNGAVEVYLNSAKTGLPKNATFSIKAISLRAHGASNSNFMSRYTRAPRLKLGTLTQWTKISDPDAFHGEKRLCQIVHGSITKILQTDLLILEIHVTHDTKPATSSPQHVELSAHVKWLMLSFDDADFADVVFRFPAKENETVLEIYSQKKILSHFCDYFEEMFESDMAESSTSKVITDAGPEAKSAIKDMETKPSEDADSEETDSDEERDRLYRKLYKPRKTERPVSVVNVRGASYTTYKAMLRYILSGTIHFGPLSSNLKAERLHPPHGGDGSDAPWVYRLEKTDVASPKSIYKLADRYRLEKLKSEALERIKTELGNYSAVYELNSKFSKTYPDVYREVAKYLTTNWSKVKNTEVWKSFADQPVNIDHTLLGVIIEEARNI
ncbi:hypothetical protein BT69DRAFT_1304042 [Atractiella rhizophila]|nr:hypothetical protein BT69DRAFT_1304042 [Atractiella rhizophila]